jgi:hypothetical protein
MATDVNFGTQHYSQFDPRSIPGCGLWLDGSDTRTLTTNGSGNVTQWADKSAAEANMTPLGTFNNATIQTNYRNGLSVVNFAGLNQYQTPANKGVYPSDVYILVALKSLVRMDVISIGPTSTDNFNSLTFGEHTALRWHNGSSGFARTPNCVSPTNETSTSLLLMNWSLANNNFVIRRNGTQLVSTATYTYTPTAGAIIQIGYRHQNFNTVLNLSAYIAEVVTYNRQLRLEERQQVEGYLAGKWGLQADLPISHPFKRSAPAMRLFQPVDPLNCAIWVDPADRSSILALSGNQPTSIRSKGHQTVTLDNAQPVNNLGPGSPWTAWPPPAVTNYGTVFMTNTSSNLNTFQFTRTTGSGGEYGNGYNGSYLRIPAVTFTSQQRTMFFVLSPQSTGLDNYAHVFAPTVYQGSPNVRQRGFLDIGGTGYVMFPVTGSSTQVLICGAVAPYTGAMLTNGTPYLFGMRHTTSTTSNYTSINGNQLTPPTNQALSTGYLTGTDEYIIGIFTYARQFLMGDFILYDGALQTSEIQQVEGYLAWKWGLRGNLPTTHPFRNFPPTTVPFVPTMFANCALWLDGADSSTITFSGTNVASWNDKSGNGRNATAGTGNIVDELGGLTFNGVSTVYNTTYTAVPGAETVFFVGRFQAGADRSYSILGATDINGRNFGTTAAGSVYSIRWEKSGSPAAVGYAPTTISAGSARFLSSAVFTGTAGTTGFNGGTQSTSAAFTLSGTTTTRIGLGSGGGYFRGVMNEIVIYSVALTQAQRQKVEGYLAWKWGLQANLPDNYHPYYKIRP